MTRHPPSQITVAVFDTKTYDREALQQASTNHRIEWHFLEFRLTQDTASAAKNARAICVFVNDQLDTGEARRPNGGPSLYRFQ